ncbi:MAG: aldo/keto reductase [Spirochaetaceae bacterium]
MEYTRLGSTGTKVSRVCLGCMSYGTPEWREWVLSEEDSMPFFRRAVEAGINFFDTADMYSRGESERVLGKALKQYAKRDEVVIATKVYFPTDDHPNAKGLSRKHIMDAIDASLRRLDTDFVDLYQIHRFDPDTPIEETMEVLDDVVKAGKARYIGASSMAAWQFAKAQFTAEIGGLTRFATMQNHYNLIYREEEREMIPFCEDQGVGLIPWSPQARGFLAGTRTRDKSGQTARSKSDSIAQDMYFSDSDFDVLEAARAVAKEKGVSSAQIALAWLMHHPAVSAPIVGATKMRHFEEAIAAVDVKLTGEEITRLEAPYVTHPVLMPGAAQAQKAETRGST